MKILNQNNTKQQLENYKKNLKSVCKLITK